MSREHDALTVAALMALGWMTAKEHSFVEAAKDPVIVNLARALKNAGTECDYVDQILRFAKPEGMERP